MEELGFYLVFLPCICFYNVLTSLPATLQWVWKAAKKWPRGQSRGKKSLDTDEADH